MVKDLKFRKATKEDTDAIVRIYERTHDAEEAGLTTTGWVRGIYPVREVAEGSIARDDMYVAELTESVCGPDGETSAESRIVATGMINKTQVNVYLDCDWEYKAPDDKVCVLHTLAVDPDVRGLGIGPAFVRFYEDIGKDWDCEVLRIDTNARNKRARKMYAKLGYIETDIIPTVFNGIRDVDLVPMEKKIEK